MLTVLSRWPGRGSEALRVDAQEAAVFPPRETPPGVSVCTVWAPSMPAPGLWALSLWTYEQ